MTSNASQWIAALPSESESASPSAVDLRALIDDLAQRPVPTGRWRRAWHLGSLQSSLVAGWLAFQLRRALAPADEHERLRHEMHLRAALKCFRTMGYLRGAVAKAGQLLASYPGVAPEAVVDLLAHLHCEAPPMHFALIREVLEAELGAPVDQLFAEFETQAFAAASLGQVHRARLPSGERVAVKVQYPGIAQAIRDDFANLSLLIAGMRMSASWRNLREQGEEIRRLVELETDYSSEARSQMQARELLAGLDQVVVPRVHERWSSRRVLTSDLLDAATFDEYLASQPPQSDRDARARQIYHSSFRLFYSGRTCYTDTHPGNFLFLRDGRLGLIDFGSMRAFDAADWAYLSAIEQVECTDHESMRRMVELSVELRDGERLEPAQFEHLIEMMDWLWAPMRECRPFDFSDREVLARGIALYLEAIERGYLRSRPINAWLSRCFCGVRALAWKLGANTDVASLHRIEARRVGFYGGEL